MRTETPRLSAKTATGGSELPIRELKPQVLTAKKEIKAIKEIKEIKATPVRTAGVQGIFTPQTAAPALHSISRFSCLKIAIPEGFLCGIEPIEP